ncbi:ATP synthase subunit O [Populus alba x Populus x berolinensis]|nr:ATP synthase subunit O [Populus alba x Populus x berolinensis]
MASARIRSGLPLLNRILRSDSLSTQRSAIQRSVLTLLSPHLSPQKISALQLRRRRRKSSGQRSKVLDQVESEILDLIEASKKSPKFSLFLKDLSVRADTRVKAINEICATAKFSEITKNFLVAEQLGRLYYLESIPLPPQEEKELKETLQDIIGQGKTVEVEQKSFEQKLFDMSIRTRAKQMERFLREPVDFDAL